MPLLPEYEVILFDLDGTLTDPRVGITRSVQYALSGFGIKETCPEKLTSFIGPPLKKSFMEFYHFDNEQADEALRKYREYFSQKGIYENELIPGIPALLERLVHRKRILAVATAKPTVYAEKILDHFALSSYFSLVSGVSLENSLVEKKETIKYALKRLVVVDYQKAVMVGDRKHDINGAAKAGIDSIGVLYGYGTAAEITAAEPTFIAASVVELEHLLLRE